MKTKRSLLLIFTLCAALSLTACNGKQPANTEKPQDTQTESSAASSDDSSSELDDLYQQENQLFADHADVWNKVFGMMNKSTADPSGNYADYLAGTVESNKDSFTEDELKTLTDDIEAIRKIEEQHPSSSSVHVSGLPPRSSAMLPSSGGRCKIRQKKACEVSCGRDGQ